MDSINILLLGGKRCGKTTVLASMCNEINKVLAGTNMRIQVKDAQTQKDLDRAMISIQNSLAQFKVPFTRIQVDDNATNAMHTYSFELALMDKKRGIPFRLHDIPGEWLADHPGEIKQLVEISQVFIIAIDTPYLFSKMTLKGYGIYHEEYNKPNEIANFFKMSLSVNDIKDRMVLFVPIKCERYYHLTYTPELNPFKRNYMWELVDAISNGYSELLRYLRSSIELIESCTIAVIPILSAGGIDFVSFCRDELTGKVVSLYQEPEFLKPMDKGYRPRFCEQPMVYALVYILIQMRENINKSNPLYQFGVSFFKGLSQKQIDDALLTLRKKIKRSGNSAPQDGFYIVQNPKGI